MDNVDKMRLEDLWPKAAELIKESLGDQIFDRWFAHLNIAVHPQKNCIELQSPNRFFKEWLQEHYGAFIKNALTMVANGEAIEVDFSINERRSREGGIKLSRPMASVSYGETPALNPRYTFDDFVIGPSNELAHAASLAVADSPGKAYNPLFIYGGVGLGKTHLMQAIGNYIIKRDPAIKVFYISSEGFMNQLIDAIQNRTTARFRERYRGVDVLLIDDIHFIAGKEATQEEFFHTFNVLYDAHKQIVVSSDRSPKQIPHIEERLVSRFEWGLVTDIHPPDIETRIAILRKKLEQAKTIVPGEVISFIADKIRSNIRELEGALIRVVAYAKFKGRPVGLDTVEEVLKDMLLEEKSRLTIEAIQERVARYFNISVSEMKTKKRNRVVVYPRQVAMYLVRELTDYSLFEIGGAFGGKDHSTVIHAQEKIESDIKNNPHTKSLIDMLVGEICGSVDKI